MPHLDHRTKVVAFGTLAATAAGTSSIYLLAGIGILLSGWLLFNGTPIRKVIRSVRRLGWFLGTIIILHTTTEDGDILFTVGTVTGTEQGLQSGLLLSLRLVLMLLCSMSLVLTTTPGELVGALRATTAPLAGRLGFIVLLLTITFNMVPRMAQLASQISLAYRSRGFDVDSGLVARLRFLPMAAVPIFAASTRLASQIANAMEARGYSNKSLRSHYRKPRLTMIDGAVMIVFVSGFLVIVAL
jgi:energy-coupling factor transport system permease protein